MTKQNIGIVYGGKSAEHSVSLLTAKSIINAIDKEKYNVFPIFISLEGNWARGKKITSEITDQHDLIFQTLIMTSADYYLKMDVNSISSFLFYTDQMVKMEQSKVY